MNSPAHGLPAQRPSRSVKPLLVVLGLSLLANGTAWMFATGPLSRQAVVPLGLGAIVLVLARITHSRVPGIGWGVGCVVAILATIGGMDELQALLNGAHQPHIVTRAGVTMVGLGYLFASVLALWFWISRRPQKPSALTPIAWR